MKFWISKHALTLQKRQDELSAARFQASAILECGDPASQIVSAAAKEGCDLIAMATHGHKGLADFILGSVASGVRHGRAGHDRPTVAEAFSWQRSEESLRRSTGRNQ